MAEDQDLTSLLPRAPPPSPAWREAAIAAALRRFDGVAEPRAAPVEGALRPSWWRRPQFGAAVAACLLVVIGLPLALVTEEDRRRAVGPADMASPANQAAEGQTAPEASAIAGVAPTPASNASPGHDRGADPAVPEDRPGSRQAGVPPGTAEASPVIAEADAKPVAPAAQALALAPAPPPASAPPPPPPSPAPADEAAEMAPPPQASAASAITPRARTGAVRGYSIASKIAGEPAAGRAAAPPDAFDACTIKDPARSLAGCQGLIDPAAQGSTGRAAARIADGLSHAWQGNLGAARSAFDQAIAAHPRSSLAYLNRALVWERQGNLKRAQADLVRALELAPGSAQVRHHLGRVRRQTGAP